MDDREDYRDALYYEEERWMKEEIIIDNYLCYENIIEKDGE